VLFNNNDIRISQNDENKEEKKDLHCSSMCDIIDDTCNYAKQQAEKNEKLHKITDNRSTVDCNHNTSIHENNG